MPITVKYQREMDTARRGAKADMEHAVLLSFTNMDDEIIGFGVPVARHEDQDKGCTADLSGGGDIVGVTVIDRSAYADRDLTVEGFRPTDECRVMRVGTIWLPAAVAVEAGDDAYATTTGTFTNATGGTKIGVWTRNAAADALGIVRLNIE